MDGELAEHSGSKQQAVADGFGGPREKGAVLLLAKMQSPDRAASLGGSAEAFQDRRKVKKKCAHRGGARGLVQEPLEILLRSVDGGLLQEKSLADCYYALLEPRIRRHQVLASRDVIYIT